jgi:hypothetical protein
VHQEKQKRQKINRNEFVFAFECKCCLKERALQSCMEKEVVCSVRASKQLIILKTELIIELN